MKYAAVALAAAIAVPALVIGPAMGSSAVSGGSATRTAGLSVNKTVLAHRTSGTNGSVFDYQLTVGIPAGTRATNVTISDHIASHMEFLGQTGVSCVLCGFPDPGTPAAGGGMVVWRVGTIPARGYARALRIRYRAIVTRRAVPGPQVNAAELTYRIGLTPRSTIATAQITVRAPKLAITKTVRCAGGTQNTGDHTCAVGPYSEADYTLVVTNVGDWGAFGATVTDTPPAGLRGISAISGHGRLRHGRITWRLVWPIAPGTHVRLTYRARVAGGLTEGQQLVNRAAVGRYYGLPLILRILHFRQFVRYPGGATDTNTLTVHMPVLTLSKTHAGGMTRGAPGTYTLAVANAGTWPTAAPVVVTDTPPVGMVPTVATGDGWACGLAGRTMRCVRATAIAAGAAAPPITLGVVVASNAADTITNSATVSGGGAHPAAAEDPTTITGPASDGVVSLRIAASSPVVAPGGIIRFPMRVTAVSADAVVGTRVCDPVPAYTTLVLAPGAQLVAGVPCWTVDYLAPGAAETFVAVARVRASAPPVIVENTAHAVADNAPPVRASVHVRVRSRNGSGGVTG
jgi:uncharacterized repeat protein (TIGR01451 family)